MQLALPVPGHRFEEGWQGDKGSNGPNSPDHTFDPPGIPFEVVPNGSGYSPVAIQTDGTEVHDGSSAEQHIQGQIETAPKPAKAPVTHDFIG